MYLDYKICELKLYDDIIKSNLLIINIKNYFIILILKYYDKHTPGMKSGVVLSKL